MDLSKYTDEDILLAASLHLAILTKTEAQLKEETKNKPYIEYYLEKLRGLFGIIQEDYKKVVAETENETNETFKFVMGDDGITEV